MPSIPSLTSVYTKLQTSFESFEANLSSSERETTANFVKAGLEQNRFVAVWQAIPAIAHSSIMILGNTINGGLKGAVLIAQGEFRKGGKEVASGGLQAFRSVYNIFFVFSTAVAGLVVPKLMYSTMKVYPTEAVLKQRNINALTAKEKQLLAKTALLQQQQTNLTNGLTAEGKAGPELKQISGLTKAILKNAQAITDSLTAQDTVVPELQEISGLTKTILKDIQAIHNPKESEAYLGLLSSYNDKVKEFGDLQNKHGQEIELLENKQREELEKAAEELEASFGKEKQRLQDEHKIALDRATTDLSEKDKIIAQIKQEHEKALENLQTEHNGQLAIAKDPEKNGTNEKLAELKSNHASELENIKKEHSVEIKSIQTELAALKQKLNEVEQQNTKLLEQHKSTVAAESGKTSEESEALRQQVQALEKDKNELNAKLLEAEKAKADNDRLRAELKTFRETSKTNRKAEKDAGKADRTRANQLEKILSEAFKLHTDLAKNPEIEKLLNELNSK